MNVDRTHKAIRKTLGTKVGDNLWNACWAMLRNPLDTALNTLPLADLPIDPEDLYTIYYDSYE